MLGMNEVFAMPAARVLAFPVDVIVVRDRAAAGAARVGVRAEGQAVDRHLSEPECVFRNAGAVLTFANETGAELPSACRSLLARSAEMLALRVSIVDDTSDKASLSAAERRLATLRERQKALQARIQITEAKWRDKDRKAGTRQDQKRVKNGAEEGHQPVRSAAFFWSSGTHGAR